MQPMSHAAGRQLRWVQPRATARQWELREVREVDAHIVEGDAGLYATLGWRGAFARITEATTTAGQWKISRPRVFGQEYQAANAVTGAIEGTLLWRGFAWTRAGHLRLASGARYKLRTSRFWSGEFAVSREESDDHLITFRRHFHAFHSENDVVFAAGAAQSPDAALLMVFGWYVRLLQIRTQRHAAMAS